MSKWTTLDIIAVVSFLWAVIYILANLDKILRWYCSFSKFETFWRTSITTFPKTRFYCHVGTKNRINPPDYDGKCGIKNGVCVDICSDRPFDKAAMSCTGEIPSKDCLVSFNRGPPQRMDWAKVVSNLKETHNFVVGPENVFFPAANSRFLTLDRIIGSYYAIKVRLLQRLEDRHMGLELGFEREIFTPSSRRTWDERISLIMDLKHFKDNYHGIYIIRETVQFLDDRILDMMPILNNWYHLRRSPDLDTNFSIIDSFELPDQVINGFWIYSTPETCEAKIYDENMIYIPSKALKALEKIKKSGKSPFQYSFCVDDRVKAPYRIVYPEQVRVSGIVEIDVETADKTVKLDKNLDYSCGHGSGNASNKWICTNCGSDVTSSKCGQYVGCAQCGAVKASPQPISHCFCPENRDPAPILTEKPRGQVRENQEIPEKVDAVSSKSELTLQLQGSGNSTDAPQSHGIGQETPQLLKAEIRENRSKVEKLVVKLQQMADAATDSGNCTQPAVNLETIETRDLIFEALAQIERQLDCFERENEEMDLIEHNRDQKTPETAHCVSETAKSTFPDTNQLLEHPMFQDYLTLNEPVWYPQNHYQNFPCFNF